MTTKRLTYAQKALLISMVQENTKWVRSPTANGLIRHGCAVAVDTDEIPPRRYYRLISITPKGIDLAGKINESRPEIAGSIEKGSQFHEKTGV